MPLRLSEHVLVHGKVGRRVDIVVLTNMFVVALVGNLVDVPLDFFSQPFTVQEEKARRSMLAKA